MEIRAGKKEKRECGHAGEEEERQRGRGSRHGRATDLGGGRAPRKTGRGRGRAGHDWSASAGYGRRIGWVCRTRCSTSRAQSCMSHVESAPGRSRFELCLPLRLRFPRGPQAGWGRGLVGLGGGDEAAAAANHGQKGSTPYGPLSVSLPIPSASTSSPHRPWIMSFPPTPQTGQCAGWG